MIPDDDFDRNLPKGLTLREHILNYISVATRMFNQIHDTAENPEVPTETRLVASGAAEAVGCSVADLQAILDHLDLEAIALASEES